MTSTTQPEWVDFQVIDAFSSKPYGGNPAAVILLDPENGLDLTDDQKLIIANEINLSETAFLTPLPCTTSPPSPTFKLQWATPANFVRLCGHATLGSTAALTHLPSFSQTKSFEYHTLSGKLIGNVVNPGVYELDFPDDVPEEVTDEDLLEFYKNAYEKSVLDVKGAGKLSKVWKGRDDIFIEVEAGERHLSEWEIKPSGMVPTEGVRGIVITTLLPTNTSTSTSNSSASPTPTPLFHSRSFYPEIGIQEDPVTGSAHCCLAVIYCNKLGIQAGEEFWATQGGKRTGQIGLAWDKQGGRIKLRGRAVKVSEGRIRIP